MKKEQRGKCSVGWREGEGSGIRQLSDPAGFQVVKMIGDCCSFVAGCLEYPRSYEIIFDAILGMGGTLS